MAQSDQDKWEQRYRENTDADPGPPSELLVSWLDRLPPGRALDLACGTGRNALYLAEQGYQVDAVDISVQALQRARRAATASGVSVNWVQCDLEHALPLARDYAVIVVTYYVDLPLLGRLQRHLAPGGFLLSEQHLRNAAAVSGPSNPAYRVAPGALARAVSDLHVHSIEENVYRDASGALRAVARLVAQRPPSTGSDSGSGGQPTVRSA
ncbi:MAG: class I SAM-dependent methyltransferase [Halioglobus sp.]|nr:class I SAM-dependent methyltransferase [Halioglobus sp.]